MSWPLVGSPSRECLLPLDLLKSQEGSGWGRAAHQVQLAAFCPVYSSVSCVSGVITSRLLAMMFRQLSTASVDCGWLQGGRRFPTGWPGEGDLGLPLALASGLFLFQGEAHPQPCHRATASHWLSWGISQTHSAGTRPSLLLPALDLQARLWPRSPLLPKASPPAFGLDLLEWRRWAGARPRVGPVRAQLCTCGLSLALQQVADAAAPPHGCVRTRSSVGPAQSRAFPVGHLACPSPFTWLPWGSLTLSAQPVPSTPAGTPTTIGSR